MNKKVAILSHTLPPAGGGQALMLYRLLKDLPLQNYILISSKDAPELKIISRSSSRLSGKYYFLKTPQEAKGIVRHYTQKSLYRRIKTMAIIVRAQTRELREILIKEKCGTLLACSGGFFDMPVLLLAIRKLKIRLVVYSFDDYIYQWTGLLRVVARIVSIFVFKRADKLIVPNEFLQRSYRKRFGKQSILIRNPYLPLMRKISKKYLNKKNINIVYTGSIYFAHFDAFTNLIKAIGLIDKPIKLHIFSDQSAAGLKAQGIAASYIKIHKTLGQSEICTVQKQADILFLSLAFKSPINQTIKTSSPGKMGEYLASGRPILVHAPKNSFISWYFKKNKCGVVVDSPNPKKLADAITGIITRQLSTKKLISNAKKCARNDFSIKKARQTFIKLLKKQ